MTAHGKLVLQTIMFFCAALMSPFAVAHWFGDPVPSGHLIASAVIGAIIASVIFYGSAARKLERVSRNNGADDPP